MVKADPIKNSFLGIKDQPTTPVSKKQGELQLTGFYKAVQCLQPRVIPVWMNKSISKGPYHGVLVTSRSSAQTLCHDFPPGCWNVMDCTWQCHKKLQSRKSELLGAFVANSHVVFLSSLELLDVSLLICKIEKILPSLEVSVKMSQDNEHPCPRRASSQSEFHLSPSSAPVFYQAALLS